MQPNHLGGINASLARVCRSHLKVWVPCPWLASRASENKSRKLFKSSYGDGKPASSCKRQSLTMTPVIMTSSPPEVPTQSPEAPSPPLPFCIGLSMQACLSFVSCNATRLLPWFAPLTHGLVLKSSYRWHSCDGLHGRHSQMLHHPCHSSGRWAGSCSWHLPRPSGPGVKCIMHTHLTDCTALVT